MVNEKKYKYFDTNNTILVETFSQMKIAGVRVKVNFRFSFDPKIVSVFNVQNLPNQRCYAIQSSGKQGSEFNQTFTFTCFTKTTDMNGYERHDRILISFSHSIECSDFNCYGRVAEVDIFQVDTDECLEPDQPRYGTSRVPKETEFTLRDGRMLFVEEESNSTDDRSRVGKPIRYPGMKEKGVIVEYECKPDFIPDNPNRRFIRTCLPGGAWISEPDAPLDDRQKPTCKPKFRCQNSLLRIPHDVHANFTDKWSSKESVADGEVFFFCSEGYKIEGVSSSKCLRDGNWTEIGPTCVERVEDDDYEMNSVTKTSNSSGQVVKKKKPKETKKWILIGSGIGLFSFILIASLIYYFITRNHSLTNRKKHHFNSEMKVRKQGKSNRNEGEMNPVVSQSSQYPVANKRPGIPIPVTTSQNHQYPSPSMNHHTYLSHNSIQNQFDGKQFTEVYSPTYEEINPLTAEEMNPLTVEETNPLTVEDMHYMDDEHGYYSGSNSSKRTPDGKRGGSSALYIHMNDGSPNVQLRKH